MHNLSLLPLDANRLPNDFLIYKSDTSTPLRSLLDN